MDCGIVLNGDAVHGLGKAVAFGPLRCPPDLPWKSGGAVWFNPGRTHHRSRSSSV